MHERQISLIDQAVESLRQTRSAFVLERSVRAAQTVLLDQRLFASNPKLVALLRKAAPWDG